MKHWAVLEVIALLTFLIGCVSYYAGKVQYAQAHVSQSINIPDPNFLATVWSGITGLLTFQIAGNEFFSWLTWAMGVMGLAIIYILIRSGNN